jgi:hypothetical protein
MSPLSWTATAAAAAAAASPSLLTPQAPPLTPATSDLACERGRLKDISNVSMTAEKEGRKGLQKPQKSHFHCIYMLNNI